MIPPFALKAGAVLALLVAVAGYGYHHGVQRERARTDARIQAAEAVLLLSACASAPPISLPAACPTVPPLPLAARQPTTAPVCLPTCSAALQSALTNWQSRLTAPALPASSASAPTTL